MIKAHLSLKEILFGLSGWLLNMSCNSGAIEEEDDSLVLESD